MFVDKTLGNEKHFRHMNLFTIIFFDGIKTER